MFHIRQQLVILGCSDTMLNGLLVQNPLGLMQCCFVCCCRTQLGQILCLALPVGQSHWSTDLLLHSSWTQLQGKLSDPYPTLVLQNHWPRRTHACAYMAVIIVYWPIVHGIRRWSLHSLMHEYSHIGPVFASQVHASAQSPPSGSVQT